VVIWVAYWAMALGGVMVEDLVTALVTSSLDNVAAAAV
jgi:hypothetical protein